MGLTFQPLIPRLLQNAPEFSEINVVQTCWEVCAADWLRHSIMEGRFLVPAPLSPSVCCRLLGVFQRCQPEWFQLCENLSGGLDASLPARSQHQDRLPCMAEGWWGDGGHRLFLRRWRKRSRVVFSGKLGCCLLQISLVRQWEELFFGGWHFYLTPTCLWLETWRFGPEFKGTCLFL